jgi:hypothetical protein
MKKFSLLILVVIIGFGIFTAQSEKDNPRWSSNPNSIALTTGDNAPAPINSTPVEIYQRPATTYYTPIGALTVNQNVRPHPSANQHNEVYITRHPINQSIMVVANQPITGGATGIQAGLYFTTNSGLSWYGDDTLNAPSMADQRGDPAPTIDKNGRIIYTHLTSTANFGSLKGMGANYSTDNGNTFSATYDVEVNTNVDKNMACTDDISTSPYYGYSYMAWTLFNGTLANGHFARTTNGGTTWDPFITLNSTPANHFAQGHDCRVGPGGALYVVWVAESSTSPYPADYLGVAKSTNGGANFTVTENAYDMNGARVSSYNGWGIRINDFPRIDIDKSGGPRNGWIYVVAGEINLAPAGSDQDIVLHRSTDGGATWNSPGIRVNQDGLNNGKAQLFPAVRVDEYGGVNVIYYDARNFANTGDSCSVFVSRSIDGGNTFTDIEIADHHFKPKLLSGVNTMGDYIGITSGNNKIWGAWMDDKTPGGNFQAWVGSIDLGPSIAHTPLTETEQTTGNRTVDCAINPAGSGINPSTAKLYYAKNSTTWSNIALTHGTGNNWSASLPLTGAGTYNYYLTATDSLSRIATSPGGAPAIYHSFNALADTIKPVITHTPINNTPKNQWPATINANVTDNIGIDSVWVKWYKNTTSTGIKHVKLPLISGSNFSAAFNSTQADVNYNDSIFYRVFAQDNGSNHKKDSTAMYKFKILNQVVIGTGTTAAQYPYYTFYDDSRTDMLYTSSELGSPAYISSIGFDVITAYPLVMNGFNLKMQNSTLTTLTGFADTTAWTVVYSGTYSVPGTGWQYINLTTPFATAAGKSLIIEICFNNNTYTTSSTVNSTTTSVNQIWHRHNDLSTTDGCVVPMTSTATTTTRPNITLNMSGTVGVTPINSQIPTEFSLSQNFPNPFNPVTRISYGIPKAGLVTLKIFDILGREISTLVNEEKQPGTYMVDFNGESFASGVYFYRIESAQFTDVKRMVLVK